MLKVAHHHSQPSTRNSNAGMLDCISCPHTRTTPAPMQSSGRFWRVCSLHPLAPASLWLVHIQATHRSLGLRPALVPNWRLALRSPWHAHMQRPLEPSTPGALFRTMASTKTDTRCAAQCGKMPGMPGRMVLRAARSLRLRAHAPPCAEVVCAVDLLAFLVGLLY